MSIRGQRAERIDPRVATRLCDELRGALRRRPAHEARLAGALRALAPFSASVADALLAAFELMVKRASFERPLYAAAARAVGELGDPRSTQAFTKALARDDFGNFATLSALCQTRDPALGAPLAKVASSRHAHWAFAGEVARIARGESASSRVALLAPKIKESHRIALCLELFVPLTWASPLGPAIGPALSVLRGAERHLGRWLVLAEVAVRAGDRAPLAEAAARGASGPQSSRGAWALVAWALACDGPAPQVRPTVELVARLCDRPSAERDTTFLFRLAREKAPQARPMLEGLAKGSLGDACAVRAALHLIRDYGDRRPLDALRAVAASPRREAIRGLAAAALFDAGEHELASELGRPLLDSRHLTSLAWGGLVEAALRKHAGEVTTEPNVRRIQNGWSE